MKKSNTLCVTHIASGDLWAGAEVQLFTLCKAINKFSDICMNVILLNHGTLEYKLRETGVMVTVLDESQLNAFQIARQLVRLLKEQKTDIVHTHRTKENILGSLAAMIVHIPSLRTIHGAPEHSPGWFRPHKHLIYIVDWLTGRYLQSCIIAVSNELKSLVSSKFQKNKIRVIENGIDIELLSFYKKTGLSNALKEQRSYKVGLIGRLVPVKRIDIFIQTARYVLEHNPDLDIKFHIYGDGPLRTEMMQLVKSLDLEKIVQFEGHYTDIYPQIALLDALLIPSDHEGLPMTLLEAMFLGIPVVAHAVGGISNVCEHGQCCWLVDMNSPGKLGKALLECLQYPEDRNAKIKQAQSRIRKHYSAEANARSCDKVYRDMIAKKIWNNQSVS